MGHSRCQVMYMHTPLCLLVYFPLPILCWHCGAANKKDVVLALMVLTFY